MAIPEGYHALHCSRMAMRWGDMDTMGHVNNTLYFRYLEQARIEAFESLGIPPTPGGIGPVIINAHCTFLRQLRYPGEIEVRTWAGALGRSSFEMLQQIRRIDEPELLYAEGGAKVVWVDQRVEKSTPLPPSVRAALLAAAG
jgi:acyl-CoA thioester hydrolase